MGIGVGSTKSNHTSLRIWELISPTPYPILQKLFKIFPRVKLYGTPNPWRISPSLCAIKTASWE